MMEVLPRYLFMMVLLFSVDVALSVTTPLDSTNKGPEYTVVNGEQANEGSITLQSGGGHDAFNYHRAKYDTASVNITNNLNEAIHIWGNSDKCYQCKFRYLSNVKAMSARVLLLDTRWKLTLAIYSHDDTQEYQNCRLHYHFGEEGVYTYFVNHNASSNAGVECAKPITVNKPPRDANIPIYIACAIYGAIALIYLFVSVGIRDGWFRRILCCFSTGHLVDRELGSVETPSLLPTASNSINNNIQPSSSKPNRLKSLDMCRGVCLCGMIFGNLGGGNYWFFAHNPWNGITVADLVSPWFVYIMGVSMTMSFHALVKYKVPRSKMMVKIIKRSVILFALGLFLGGNKGLLTGNSGGNTIADFRVTGILQRFSISYLVVACFQWLSATPERHARRSMSKYYRPFCDILDYWYEWIFMAALMVIYSCLAYLLPVPGCPIGYIGPGGPLVPWNGTYGPLENCTGGAAAYIDKLILGKNHICRPKEATVRHIYLTEQPYDAEGILGYLPCIFLVYLGLQAGKILLLFQRHDERLIRFTIWGVVLGGLGTLLCGGSKEGGWVPINKNLWSTSFVLLMAGSGFILLAFSYFIIDVKKWWSGAPFYYTGMNSILLYIGHELLRNHFPFAWQPVHETHAEMLSMHLIGTSLWVIIAYWMYCKKFFVKI